MSEKILVTPAKQQLFREGRFLRVSIKEVKQVKTGDGCDKIIVSFAHKDYGNLNYFYNFTIPDKSKKIMKEFFSLNNPIREFVETQIQADPNGRTTYKKMAESYLLWLQNEGIPQPVNFNRRTFSSEIKAVLNTLEITYHLGGKSDDSRRIDGISLKQKTTALYIKN